MLVDEVTILAKAGIGGNGSISFKRNAQTARGGPDGGNGGKGGDVYITGVNDIDVLQRFSYTKEVHAENGVNGAKQNLYGRNGKDLTINVPFGTLVYDLSNNTGFEIINGEKILIAKGGKGGRGNNEFKSATNQAPRYRELGEKGEEKKLKLELKLIADIGIIGLPNAGKSSLLSLLTNAHPKIGNYPFTTLEPNLGVMPALTRSNGDDLIIADIPGLIEGASGGKGLGDKFLRHIERTKILVHCIDGLSENILNDYEVIRTELGQFNRKLLEKKEIILITKIDNVLEEKIEEIKKIFKKTKKDIYFISIYDNNLVEKFKSLLMSSIN